MTREEALSIPYGELLDYVAIEQIKHEGAKLKEAQDPEDEFFKLLRYKQDS